MKSVSNTNISLFILSSEMLKVVSLVNILAKNDSLNALKLRGFKTKGEYFKRFGYKYTDHFKGGKFNILY